MPDKRIKYVFLDVVNFTKRDVEAQSSVVSTLNELVSRAVEEVGVSVDKRLYIPTGDGMCIALLELDEPLDLHLKLALKILENIQVHNNSTDEPELRFGVRVGINENVDNLVQDINGRQNVAGAGINLAQRLMDQGDAGQIIVGTQVFEILKHRRAYKYAFRSRDVKVKHGYTLTANQYLGDSPGLDRGMPSAWIKEERLTSLVAHYMAHALKNRDFFMNHLEDEYTGIVLLWFLAKDSLGRAETPAIQKFTPSTPHAEAGLEAQLEYFKSIKFSICSEFTSLIRGDHLWVHSDLFEKQRFGLTTDFRFLSPRGINKLRQEFPELLTSFGIDQPSEPNG
jgi:adenylate/guanylate cyclase family protein